MYKKAGNSGNLTAQHRLETAYRNQAKVEEDPAKKTGLEQEAHNWTVKAAMQIKDDSAWLRMIMISIKVMALTKI